MSFRNFVYIDESGSGSPKQVDINRIWVSAAISVSFDDKVALDKGIKKILEDFFRSKIVELKGTNMPNELLRGKTIDDVVSSFHTLISSLSANIWVAGTFGGRLPPPGFKVQTPHAKEIARQMLLERINDYLNAGYEPKDHFLLIWDISDVQELTDFSEDAAAFKNDYTGDTINPRLAPAILGGCSHDWSGLQAADMIAHLAFHRIGIEDSIQGANPVKAKAFMDYIWPVLRRDSEENVVGWKKW